MHRKPPKPDEPRRTVDHDDTELSAEWREEIARRIERLRSGEAKPVPPAEVDARIRESVRFVEALRHEDEDRIVDMLVALRRGTDGVSPDLRKELLHRVRRIRSGEATLLDGDEAFRLLRAKYDG